MQLTHLAFNPLEIIAAANGRNPNDQSGRRRPLCFVYSCIRVVREKSIFMVPSCSSSIDLYIEVPIAICCYANLKSFCCGKPASPIFTIYSFRFITHCIICILSCMLWRDRKLDWLDNLSWRLESLLMLPQFCKELYNWNFSLTFLIKTLILKWINRYLGLAVLLGDKCFWLDLCALYCCVYKTK